jgi:HK97 family phage portal protein
MSIFGALRRERRALTESEWLLRALGATATATGRQIGANEALHISATYACVRVIAETIGSLPLVVYRRLASGGKVRDPGYPLYRLLHDQANPVMTSMEVREALTGHAVLHGNGYAEIERDGGDGIRALWPLRPDRMTVFSDPATDEPRYLYTAPDGRQVAIPWQNVLHLRNFGSGGLTGYSTIELFRESYALALAAEEYGARFFANDSRPGGVLEVPHKLRDPERLKASWEAAHRGMRESWRVAVLEEGVTWKQIGIPPKDAEFLGLRKFQIAEIARIFRVPLHMIGELDRATFSNIEHQALEFVMHTVRPWAVRWEQVIMRDLFFRQPGARGRFAEHVLDGLLRGDALARAQALAIQRQNGVLTANEWREIENRNPIEGGDALLVNGNMLPIGPDSRPAGAAPEGPATGEGGD